MLPPVNYILYSSLEKGLFSIQYTRHLKGHMSDSHSYPLNLYLINVLFRGVYKVGRLT